jgi:hypothetical protein
MNCRRWTVGYLAWREQRQGMEAGQGRDFLADLEGAYTWGVPLRMPPGRDVGPVAGGGMSCRRIPLGRLTTQALQERPMRDGKATGRSTGSALRRSTHLDGFQIGETQVIRRMLGPIHLPEYVGELEPRAPYRLELWTQGLFALWPRRLADDGRWRRVREGRRGSHGRPGPRRSRQPRRGKSYALDSHARSG